MRLGASSWLVIWQRRCLCRCKIGISDQCYLFDCSREPPPIGAESICVHRQVYGGLSGGESHRSTVLSQITETRLI